MVNSIKILDFINGNDDEAVSSLHISNHFGENVNDLNLVLKAFIENHEVDLISENDSELFVRRNDQTSIAIQNRLLKRKRRRLWNFVVSAATIIGLVAGVFGILGISIFDIWNICCAQADLPMIEQTDKKPKIIGIYPRDYFGKNQRDGLNKSISNGDDLGIINIDFLSIDEMKSNKFKQLEDTLIALLQNENIIAIAGPPITESADDALNLFARVNTKVPIFMTTAAPRKHLRWDEFTKKLNLFRIGTGIDDRATSLSFFLERQAIIAKTAILVEENRNSSDSTYGEMFYQYVSNSQHLKKFKEEGRIGVFKYDRNDINNYDSIFNSLIRKYQSVFLFGVGKPYMQTINKYYKDKSRKFLPIFGGYMFGYALNEELEDKKPSSILQDKIFEITDLDLFREESNSNSITKFKDIYTGFHPGLRDEASYFDVGICISKSYNLLRKTLSNQIEEYDPSRNILFTQPALDSLNKILHQETFDGVSSRIKFNRKGLNEGYELRTAMFDPKEAKWEKKTNDEINEIALRNEISEE